MTAKARVLNLIQRLPDDVSYAEIARMVEFVAGIREAQEQIARGEGISPEDLLRELPAWIAEP
jgi:hypothetical protein